jgi:hypothetical protein
MSGYRVRGVHTLGYGVQGVGVSKFQEVKVVGYRSLRASGCQGGRMLGLWVSESQGYEGVRGQGVRVSESQGYEGVRVSNFRASGCWGVGVSGCWGGTSTTARSTWPAVAQHRRPPPTGKSTAAPGLRMWGLWV